MKHNSLTQVFKALALLPILMSGSAFGVTGYWTGAGNDGKWTNADNWKDGVIPGRYTVSDVTQGDFGDTAVFGAVAAGARTTVVLGNGLLTIGTIRITGPDAPSYKFGNVASDAQSLQLEAGGGFIVGNDVINMPTFGGYLYTATAVSGVSPTQITIENESSQTLDLPKFIRSSTWSNIEFKGSGDIRLNGAFDSNTETLVLNQTGRFIVNTYLDGRDTWGKYGPCSITTGKDTPLVRIVINKDCQLRQRLFNVVLDCTNADIEISGEGQFVAETNDGRTETASGLRVIVPSGRTLTFASGFASKYISALSDEYGFRCYTGGGTIRFCGKNTMSGTMDVYQATFEALAVDATDEVNYFGTGLMRLGAGGVLKYIGAGERTARELSLQSIGSTTSCALEHSGTGPWTVANFMFASSTANGTLTLRGERDDAEMSSVLANSAGGKSLSVTKENGGTWTLSAVNTYTGATTVNGGVLKVAATGSIAMSSELAVKGGMVVFEGEGEPTAQTVQKLTISENGTLVLSGKVTVTVASVSRASGKVLDIVTDSTDAKLVVPVGTAAAAFTWNGQPVVIGEDGEVKIEADAVIAARGDIVPSSNGKVVIFNQGTTGNDTLAADTTTLAKLTQLSKTASTVEIGANRTLAVSAVALAEGAADLTLGAVGDKGALDSPTKVFSLDNRSVESEITLNAAIGAGVTNEFAYGGAVIAGDTTLGFTRIAIVDKAKAQLEVRDCTVETGFEPIQIGANTGTDYSGGGMQYGELTVSNALIRNVADLARASHSYSAPSDYGILVGMNASGILRVQDGAVISNKLQIGTGISGTSGRGSGAVYQSGGTVCTVGKAEYRANCMGDGSAFGYYELKGGSFVGYMQIAPYGYAVWHQEPDTTADLKALDIATANGGHADVYIRGTLTAATSASQIAGGYQSVNVSVITVDGPGYLNLGSQTAYAFNSSSSDKCFVNFIRGGKIRVGDFYRHSSAYGNAGLFDISFDGGVLVTGKGNSEVFASGDNNWSKTYVDHVRIYKGGMTVDTEERNVGTKLPLLRPDGLGVASISFDYTAFKKWHTPPYIQISGDGTGATAHALYDSENQAVTGVVITCSGRGYVTETTTVKAVYKGNGAPSAVTGAFTLAENDPTGSFTKRGTGTFTLGAANTWGGATIAAGGTLKANCDWAIPADSPVVLSGGKIDFGGKVGSVSKITYKVGGGSIVNAENVTLPTTFDMAITTEEVLAKQSIPLTGDQDLTGKTLTITGDFSSLDPNVCRKYTVVSVTGGAISGEPTIVAPALPKDWSFVTRPNGVKLVNPLGMLMIVR